MQSVIIVTNMEHRKLALILSTVFLLSSFSLAAEVFRWVDENGDVHYSETLPPDFDDKSHDVLDDRGITLDEDLTLTPDEPKPATEVESEELPRDASGMQRPEPRYAEAELKARMDTLLLLRYESEEELIAAMDVEIRQLEYDRRLLSKTRDSISNSYRDQIRAAANRQRAGQAVAAETDSSVAQLRTRLAHNNKSMATLDNREEQIRIEFGAQLKRYRALIETSQEDKG